MAFTNMNPQEVVLRRFLWAMDTIIGIIVGKIISINIHYM